MCYTQIERVKVGTLSTNQPLNIQLSHCCLSLPFARDERFSAASILAWNSSWPNHMQPLLGALTSFFLPLLPPDTQVAQDNSYECL